MDRRQDGSEASPAGSNVRSDAPISSLLIVNSQAEDGRDDEYNDWYTHVHCHDVMRLDSSFAVQRFKVDKVQLRDNRYYIGPWQRYLAIWEIADTKQSIEDHIDYCFTDRMPISSAIQSESTDDFFYVSAEGDKDALRVFNSPGMDVVTIYLNATARNSDRLEELYPDEVNAEIIRLSGFISGGLYRFSEHQLATDSRNYEYLAIYPVSDKGEAVGALDKYLSSAGSLFHKSYVDRSGVRIACYSTIAPRLTAERARRLPPEEQAVEDRVRASLGERRLPRRLADHFKRA